MKNCLIIDGNSIINRAFYGVRALTTHSGKPTNAIFGMINMVSRQLDSIKPTYAAVAFDLKAPTFRHQMYTEYKAGRHATPDELLAQFDDAKAILTAMGLHVLSLEGYEADDIQGTIARMAGAEKDTHAYILSGDRDLFQLIDENTTVLYVGNKDTTPFHPAEFGEKYAGLSPLQLIDLKALMGDASDHIPGVAGVGEKTALKLMCEFGSLDAIYENIDSPCIAKGVREKLIAHKDDAYLSRTLAEIKTDVPLERPLESLAYSGFDNDSLYTLLSELELTSFIQRFHLHAPTVPLACEAGDACYIPANISEIKSIGDKFAFHMLGDKIYLSNGDRNLVFEGDPTALAPLFDKGNTVICYDGKKLYHTLRHLGILPECTFADVILYAYVINSGVGVTPLPLMCSSTIQKTVADDAPAAHLLYEMESALSNKIEEIGCTTLLEEIELPLIYVLGEMEENGFLVDKDGLLTYGEGLKTAANKIQAGIYEMVGHPFNLNSPKQLGEVLFEELHLPFGRKKKTGGYSTDADTLQHLRNEHPIIEEILLYRQLTKLYGTYIVGLISAIDESSRIHTDFKQALTATGRLSSAEPNLQNIPIRTPLGREIRRYFIPSPGHVLVDADYSQIELRLLAILSKDEAMTAAFNSGEDIHTATAASAFRVPIEEVTPELRKRAKAINFGIVYGISAYSLADDLGVSNAEAKAYIESYKETYPRITEYLDGTVASAAENGYTTTLYGRRRYIPELKSSNGMQRAFGKRIAMNAPLQGTAADVMKLAMVKVRNALKTELPEARLLMQVHDELVLECPTHLAEKAGEILRREMEGVANLSVPLTADVTIGKDWMK